MNCFIYNNKEYNQEELNTIVNQEYKDFWENTIKLGLEAISIQDKEKILNELTNKKTTIPTIAPIIDKEEISIPPNYKFKDKEVQQIDIEVNPQLLSLLQPILQELNDNDQTPIIVGGAIRDAILGKKPKDIDIEIYNISMEDLQSILNKYGKVDEVGKAFGILKFIPYEKGTTNLTDIAEPFDFSIPRRENKTGIGYKGFTTEFDTTITIKEAASRRDFTWNSLGYNPITNTLYDYYGGVKDLQNGIIRATSEKFAEDPLRILRAMQFQARTGHSIAPETYALMKEILSRKEFDHLVSDELYAAFLKEKVRLTAEYKKHVDNNLMLLKQALNNYNKFGILYHGTSNESIVDTIEPPSKTNVIQETTRKKNLDKVFFTKTAKSADIYAGRSLNVNGGTKKVYSVVPVGNVDILNNQAGTEVYMADKAIIVDDTIDIEKQLIHYFNNIIFPQQDEYDEIVNKITKERILGEWEKWSMKGKYHSKLFDFLRKSGLGEKLYPKLLTLKNTEQDYEYHPEGDVEEHTKQVMNKAIEIANRENLNSDDRTVLLFATLLHDIGKPETTKREYVEKKGREVVTSKGHEALSADIAKKFLTLIGIKQSLQDRIIPIVREHLAHATISSLENSKQKKSAFLKLIKRLDTGNVRDLLFLMEADMLGRNNSDSPTPQSIIEFKELIEATKDEVSEKGVTPMITGKDLVSIGYKQGKELGQILKNAFDAQLNQDFTNRVEAIQWLTEKLNLSDTQTNTLYITDTLVTQLYTILTNNTTNNTPTTNAFIKWLKRLNSNSTETINQLKELVPEFNLGTDEQIQAFLDTIYLDSEVNQILFHSSHKQLQSFDNLNAGTHFGTYQAAIERNNGIVIPVLLNITNPAIFKDILNTEVLEVATKFLKENSQYLEDGYRNEESGLLVYLYHLGKLTEDELWDALYSNRAKILKVLQNTLNADGYQYINEVEDKGSLSYVVFNPNQVAILNSPVILQKWKEYLDIDTRKQNIISYFENKFNLPVEYDYNLPTNVSGYVKEGKVYINPNIKDKDLENVFKSIDTRIDLSPNDNNFNMNKHLLQQETITNEKNIIPDCL